MKILLVGAGGYGAVYVRELLKNTDPDVILEGVVEPYFDTCVTKADITAAAIPVYKNMEEFYNESLDSRR